MNTQRSPLAWPTGWPRTSRYNRKRAAFHGTKQEASSYQTPGQPVNYYRRKQPLTLSQALDRLLGEMRRMGVRVEDLVISSDLKIRLDGLPYAAQAQPADPGVAVYFRLRKVDRVLACDAWDRIPDNIAAIAAHVECIRGMDRYKVGTLDQAFAGYAALPAKGSTWRTTLGFAPDAAVTVYEINAAFRERARTAHPDIQGGSHDAMASLTEAKMEGLKELSQ